MHRRCLAPLLLAGHLACAPSAPACPPASSPDAGRAQAVLTAARSTRAGQHLALDHKDAAICFGGLDRGSLLPDGVVVISSSLDDAAASARLIHLRTHVADELHRFPWPDIACDVQMERVLAAEARAMAAEIAACAELGCGDPPYTFALDILAAPASERTDRMLARLRDEPTADGLDATLRRYRERCEQAR